MKQLIKNNWARIKRILKILLLVGMLIGFFFYVPIKDIYVAVRAVDAKLFWGSFFWGFPTLYLAALKLWFFTNKQELDLKVHQIFLVNLVVRFYSFFSPASIVGSGLKWYKFSSKGKETQALLAIAVSRIWDVFLAFTFGLLWMFMGINTDIIHPGFLVLFIGILISIWFIALRYSPLLENWVLQKESDTNRKLFKKLFSLLGKLFNSFSLYKKLSLPEVALLIGISIVTEVAALFGHTLLAMALDIPISFVDLGWMRSIFFLSALAPFTMVGGIGLREVSIVLVMSGFGISTELAVAYSFLLYARSVLLYLVGGVVELFTSLK